MKPSITRIVVRSLSFNRKRAIYLILIIGLLSSVITASLLTGFSVRQSLRKMAGEKLGKTGILVSSGPRFFSTGLSERVSNASGLESTDFLEIKGYCSNFATGKNALDVIFYGVSDDFFSFHGSAGIKIEPGTAAINEKLANQLEINPGDQIIITYKRLSTIPSSLPFAPDVEAGNSKVLTVSRIITKEETGNFSLGISQLVPFNVFLDLQDITYEETGRTLVNRFILAPDKDMTINHLRDILEQSVSPEDIGLEVRQSPVTGNMEIISDRIFIDHDILEIVMSNFPGAGPVITYLVNSLSFNGMSAPYSFVSGLPGTLYPIDTEPGTIYINKWLSADIGASAGDTVEMTWYSPDSFGKLEETGGKFRVSQVEEMKDIWSDRSLMPEFPGISGSKTCSEWDAGVALDMNRIRDKDEEYWNEFKGTPKAFISYESAKQLWGNNFGPATAIRFPAGTEKQDIVNKLTGSFIPERSGFVISVPVEVAEKAAGESVDFSTLFLSLGFFIIVSCIVLLLLSVSSYFDARITEIRTLYGLGFTNRWIGKYLLAEMFFISIVASLPGILAGIAFNYLLISALNSVWTGAVQTDTLGGYIGVMPLIYSMLATVIVSAGILLFKTIRFLKSQQSIKSGRHVVLSPRLSLIFLIVSSASSLLLLVLSFMKSGNSMIYAFSGGGLLFVAMLLLFRVALARSSRRSDNRDRKISLTKLYYSYSPSHALTPVMFIAAGLFAVFITGSNRSKITDSMNLPSSGTGGYLLWGETAVPVPRNLGTRAAINEFGLDDDGLKDLEFVQGKVKPGNDASCLNLNHIVSPPLLGIDPDDFIKRGSFSFASSIEKQVTGNEWELLTRPAENGTIYGIADQTVLDWGLMLKTGDTLIMETENGQRLNIIMAAGLKSSLFQGYVLIGENNFDRFYPSISGYSVFLADGPDSQMDKSRELLESRFSVFGVFVEPARDKLASFFEVTNTYLSVFEILGALGVFIGVFGLGFVLMRNYQVRKREFALMLATGFSIGYIKRMIFREQIIILLAGLFTGILSAIMATLPSVRSGSEMPWLFITVVAAAIFAAGAVTLLFVTRNIAAAPVISALRRE